MLKITWDIPEIHPTFTWDWCTWDTSCPNMLLTNKMINTFALISYYQVRLTWKYQVIHSLVHYVLSTKLASSSLNQEVWICSVKFSGKPGSPRFSSKIKNQETCKGLQTKLGKIVNKFLVSTRGFWFCMFPRSNLAQNRFNSSKSAKVPSKR